MTWNPLVVVAVAAAVLAAGFTVTAATISRRGPLRRATSLLVSSLFAVLAVLATTVVVATEGYRALTREEVAATVRVKPVGPGHFEATFRFPDGRSDTFDLRGDQLYVDAHILKWKPMANMLGLHTAYELDRVGGRYRELQAERDSVRTVYSLAADKPLDMFSLRGRWSFLGPILDAEYGSGTFQDVEEPSTFEVRVSTAGLLIRPRGEG